MEKEKGIIGQRLYHLRKKNRFEVNYILDKLGIARSTLNGYEAGTRSPNWEMLVKLSELYNTTVDYIIGNTDDEMNNDPDTLRQFLESNEIVYKGKKLNEDDTKMINNLAEMLNTILEKYEDK